MGLLRNRGDDETESVDIHDPANRTHEYKVSTRAIGRGKANEEQINELDARGWEFVDSFITNGTTFALLFRRPYPSADTSSPDG